MRVIKNSKQKFVAGIYNLSIVIKHKEYNKKEFLNAEVVKYSLVEKIVADHGVVVDLE
jgi:hypothetical protein